MTRIAIVTDSTADLPSELRAVHDITMVPFLLRSGDVALRDQIDITSDQFIRRYGAAGDPPVAAQPGPSAYRETFIDLAERYDEVVAVLISSKLSTSVLAARQAAEDVAGIVHVEVVDSFNVSLGLGFQALRATELAQAGWNARDIARRLHTEVNSFNLAFFVDTLDYLKRGERIGGAASLIGSLLQLKPVLRIDEGQVVPYERTRTRARAIESLREFAAGWPAINRLGVVYSQDRAEAEQLLADLPSPTDPSRVVIAQLSAVLSAHVGPGVLGVCIDDTESI
ncbi:MAG: DegV family protein [Thermomicrobiales bacterium]|nr:DegV family protein [Thermomicrobiales bacterium]